MNTIREVQRINDEELKRGIAGTRASWHTQYAKSAWVYVGNLDHGLVEGDVICVLSQHGEIDDFHLVRDEETGKSRGFAFCKYEDARSCVLAVDNFCGIQLCGRSLRVDHVENYRVPKHILEKEEQGVDVTKPGAAYEGATLSNQFSLEKGQDLFAPPAAESNRPAKPAESDDETAEGSSASDADNDKKDKKQRKEERRQKREERAQRKREREERRTRREEERRKRRAQRMAADPGDDDAREDRSSRKENRKENRKKPKKHRKHSHDREKRRERRRRSRSPSNGSNQSTPIEAHSGVDKN